MTFCQVGRKIRVHTTASQHPLQALTPICDDTVNFVEGLTEEEVAAYQDASPDFLPLFDIYVLELFSSSILPTSSLAPLAHGEAVSPEGTTELIVATSSMRSKRTEFDRIQAMKLEDFNLGTSDERRTVRIASQLPP